MNLPPSHQRARQIALQALFEADISNHAAVASLERLLHEERLMPGVADLARALVAGVAQQHDEVDALIREAAPLWPLDQVAAIDRNVLRVAAYELVLQDGQQLPDAVIINQAVELAKRFGSDSSARFVNGVLGTLVRSVRTPNKRVASS